MQERAPLLPVPDHVHREGVTDPGYRSQVLRVGPVDVHRTAEEDEFETAQRTLRAGIPPAPEPVERLGPAPLDLAWTGAA